MALSLLSGAQSVLDQPAVTEALFGDVSTDCSCDIIGDMHGRVDLRDQLLDKMNLQIGAAQICDPHLVFVGDDIDRGPDSVDLLERLQSLSWQSDNRFVSHAGANPLVPRDRQTPKQSFVGPCRVSRPVARRWNMDRLRTQNLQKRDDGSKADFTRYGRSIDRKAERRGHLTRPRTCRSSNLKT